MPQIYTVTINQIKNIFENIQIQGGLDVRPKIYALPSTPT
jgi:hypothetical protein